MSAYRSYSQAFACLRVQRWFAFPKDPTTADPIGPSSTRIRSGVRRGRRIELPNAIENTKRLGCGFEAADPAQWCATLTAKQVSCMSARIQELPGERQCTEPTK
jgi:hypothetical protein